MATITIEPFALLHNVFIFLENTLGNYLFVLIVTCISFALKAYVVWIVTLSRQTVRGEKHLRFLLVVTLIGFIITDLSWILKLLQLLLASGQKIFIVRIVTRLAWATTALLYLAFALFIESLVVRKGRLLKLRHLPLFLLAAAFFAFFTYSMICMKIVPLPLLLKIQNTYNTFILIIFMLPSICFTLWKLRSSEIPRLLKYQAKTCVQFFIFPQIFFDFFQFFPFGFTPPYVTNSFALVSISTIFLTIALYLCTRQIVRLRFLNVTDHVQTTFKYTLIDRVCIVFDQLSHAVTLQDVQSISCSFFSQTFGISPNSIRLHASINPQSESMSIIQGPSDFIERVLLEASPQFIEFIKSEKVLIYDELELSNFYKPTAERTRVLELLQSIAADILIPIYKDDQLVGTITIDRYARARHLFYTDVERNEMIVFTQYISHIIYLIQHRSFTQLLESKRALEHDVYQKAQQIQHYKESLNTLISSTKAKIIGVLFYRSRRFLLGNWNAQKLLGYELSSNLKHPVSKQIKKIAELALETRTQHNVSFFDVHNNKVIAIATPSISQSHIIITLAYADTCEFIKEQIEKIHNPHDFDYLLYLETTRSGQLINQLVPGSAKELMTFKIELLRAAFGKQPLLLDMADEDFLPAVDIIHQIGLRNKLHVLHLKEPTITEAIAHKLFGINPLFAHNSESNVPLLEQLTGADTLFIQNVQFLDLVTQEYLLELIKYGYYRQYKSYHKKPSSVRIIVSSSQPLELLVSEEKFNRQLYDELQKTSLHMPWLETLDAADVQDLAQSMSQQLMGSHEAALSDRDLYTLTDNRPTSLKEFKQRVIRLLKQQTNQPTQIIEMVEAKINAQGSNTDLNAIPRGRQALKSQKIMTLLWNKFKNQNSIASFLGVNRSSVNRRCKKFNLQ